VTEEHTTDEKLLVLCEYSKFQIESNSYFSIRFEMKKHYLHSTRN